MRRGALLLGMAAALLGGCGSEPRQEEPAPAPALQFRRVATDSVAHGERLARVLGCIGCHGEDLTGEDWSEPGFGRLWTANLTRALPRYTDQQLARTIMTGVAPDGRDLWEMPSHLFTQLAPGDMAALIAYLRTRPPAGPEHPEPLFEQAARREIAAGLFKSSSATVGEEGGLWPPQAGSGHALARYIVRATCAECHGMNLEGGQPHPEAVHRPDLRIVGAYERAQFRRLLRTGIAAGDRRLGMMGDVARGRYRHLTEDEVNAVYDYLHAFGTSP